MCYTSLLNELSILVLGLQFWGASGTRTKLPSNRDSFRMLHLGQDVQTSHAIVSRPGKLPNQFTNTYWASSVKEIENALNWKWERGLLSLKFANSQSLVKSYISCVPHFPHLQRGSVIVGHLTWGAIEQIKFPASALSRCAVLEKTLEK